MKIRADEIDLEDVERLVCFPSVIFNCKIKILLLQKKLTILELPDLLIIVKRRKAVLRRLQKTESLQKNN